MATSKDVRFTLSAADRTAAVFRGVQGRLEGLERTAGVLNASFGRIAGAFGGAFIGATFTSFVGNVARGLDALVDLRDATGSSVENLSALEDLAARTGTSFEGMATSVVRFNKVLAEATPGSNFDKILSSIGLSARELRTLDPAEALRRTAVALRGFTDDGDKARIVQELFGKSIKEVGPFLAELANQTRLVGTVTTQQAEAAEQFNKELAALRKNAVDLARSLVSDLIPALNRVFEANRQGGINAAGGALLGFSQQEREANALRNAERTLQRAQQRFADAAENPGLISRLFGTPQSRQAELDRLEGDVVAAQTVVDRLRRQLDERQLGAESDNELARRFAGGRRSAPALPATGSGKSPSLTAEQIARLQVEAEEQAARDSAEAWRFWQEQRLKDTKAATDAEALMWRQIFDEIDAEQDRAIEDGRAFLEQRAEQLSDFAQQARRNLQDATGDTIEAALDGDFDRIERQWGDLLKRMVAQALAARLNEALFGKTGTGGDTGALGSVLRAFGIPSFDVGTPYVPRDMLAYVHEGERITPAAQNRGGDRAAPQITLAPVYHIGQGVNRAEVAQAVAAGNARLMGELNRMVKREQGIFR